MAGKAPRCDAPLGAPEESQGPEGSEPPQGFTGQSKDMGPTGRHVTAFNGKFVKHVRSILSEVTLNHDSNAWTL